MRSSEKPGIIKSIDDSIALINKVSDTFMTNLQQRDPEAYAMMEKALGWGATVAQAAAFRNPYTAVATGALMAADAVGATAWAKEKIRTELKELGFEKSCDTLASGIILVAESKASGWTRNGATQSAALTKIAEKAHGKVYTRVDELSYVSGGRKVEGVAHYSRPLPTPETILKGSQNSVGIVPQEVASKMSGKSYNNFDAFRKDFWKAMADSKYAREFGDLGIMKMKVGRAPDALEAQRLGKRSTYELHHKTPINQGGSVYDLSNIQIVTPLYHKITLLEDYHYGR